MIIWKLDLFLFLKQYVKKNTSLYFIKYLFSNRNQSQSKKKNAVSLLRTIKNPINKTSWSLFFNNLFSSTNIFIRDIWMMFVFKIKNHKKTVEKKSLGLIKPKILIHETTLKLLFTYSYFYHFCFKTLFSSI